MALLKLVTLMTIISFLWSGLVINLFQLLNHLLIRRWNFKLFVKINYYLMYSAWSQIVALFDWFFGASFKVYHPDKEAGKEMFKDNNIFLANHSYELDWVGAWLVTDKYGQLASCKAMLKSDLKYIPIVGWSWALSDQLFLDRNWEKDKHNLNSSIDTLLKYEPLVATFFCEGTRLTKDKVADCQKFAAERNIKAPKYHLIPRTKGFVAVAKHLKKRQAENPNMKVFIYNAQVAYEPSGALSIGDIIKKGLAPKGHIYFERISLDQIPGNDEDCTRWLQEFYYKKDDLQEYFNKNNKFPGHVDEKFINYRPRLTSLANWILWQSYTILPVIYMIICLYLRYGPLIVSMVISTIFLMSYVYLNYVIYQADVSDDANVLKSKNKQT